MVTCSCHGLVLVRVGSAGDESLNLFNPITMETRKVLDFGCADVFLGYDSIHDDYKIFSPSDTSTMGIYSLKMETWRSLGNPPYKHSFHQGSWFLNGCIHCSAWKPDEGRVVLTALEELPLPKGFDGNKFGFVTILGGCLALMFLNHGQGYVDFWVMKEYGVADSWTKCTVTTAACQVCNVGVLGEDELVFLQKSGLIVYNWRLEFGGI